MNAYLHPLSRSLVALIFITSGAGELFGSAAASGMAGAVGFPAPSLSRAAAILIGLAGGTLLLVGYETRWARQSRLPEVAVFCFVTTATLWAGGFTLVLAFWFALALMTATRGVGHRARAGTDDYAPAAPPASAAAAAADMDDDCDCVYVFVGRGDELTQRRVRLSRDGERLRLTPCEEQDDRRRDELRAA